MNADVEFHIRQNDPWTKLPANVRQSVGNSKKEYDKQVVNFSVKNQLRYKGNLVRHIKKSEKQYYEELLRYSQEHLMLYPYHLSDVMVKGLRITPFAYYINIMCAIMSQEKSYDSLPNFTAADCLRLLGIGRNQYIDLMNQCRSSKKFFGRRKPVRELLPPQPIDRVVMEPWWMVQAGYITDDDVKACSSSEKNVIDTIIDNGPQLAGGLDYKTVHALYRKGLVYIDVPIADDDCIIVPPLEGFVMNRVLGDYFETLLYKIFVSIDEHTTVAELANILEIDPDLVKSAVSVYCRLAFARKKSQETTVNDCHPSWKNIQQPKKPNEEQTLLIDWSTALNEPVTPAVTESSSPDSSSVEGLSVTDNVGHSKRIAFLFDSTLTAFLMMGNLSPGLKSHAVTMFEVGKLSDESLDSFLAELDKVESGAEGEAQRYFDHAITLRDTIKFLRYNKDLVHDKEQGTSGHAIDLIRCESLLGLEPATCARVLNKNYSLLVSMAPLSNEIRPVSSCTPQHIGPAIPEVNSVWFKMFIYHLTGSGPPSLLLVKGTKLRKLPKVFRKYEKLMITTWGHDPAVVVTSNVLLTLNDALSHSAVLLQGHSWQRNEGEIYHIPFPFDKNGNKEESTESHLEDHSAIVKMKNILDLKHTCGYLNLLKTGNFNQGVSSYDTNIKETISTPSAIKNDVSRESTPEHVKAKNGLQDLKSAEILADEVDSMLNLDNNTQSPKISVAEKKAHMTLDVRTTVSKDNSPTGLKDVESRWVLLDCCYGIPLFNAHLNNEVCMRIASQSLCSKDSLQCLLQSSRRLTLRLLNFIAEHQDLPIIQEFSHEVGMLPKDIDKFQQTIPLPTKCLYFNGGKVETWDGK